MIFFRKRTEITTEFRKSNKIEIIIKRIQNNFIFIIIVFLSSIIVSIAAFTGSIKTIVETYTSITKHEEPIFKKSDKDIKILFVPFFEISQDGKQDMAYIIKQRLEKLNNIDTLHILTHYIQKKVTQNFNDDSAKYLLEFNNADMIIYGDYDKNNIDYDINCKYYFSDRLKNNKLNIKNQTDNIQISLSDIRNGKLQGSVEFCIYWICGNSEYQNKNYSKALKYLNKASELNPTYANVYCNLGDVYYSINNYNRAINNYDKAIVLDPLLSEAYFNRGCVNIMKGDTAIAGKDLDKAIDINNKSAFYYYIRGSLYYSKKDMNLALSDYNKAIKLDSKVANYYSLRGRVYRDKEDYGNAMNDFNKALNLNPNDGITYFTRGYVYYMKGEIDSAIMDYNKSLMFKQNFAEAYFYRGEAYYEKDNEDNAIKDYNKAIALNPKYVSAYISRGICFLTKTYLTKIDIDNAVQNLLKARELDPKDHSSWLPFALAIKAKKNYKYDGQIKIEKPKKIKANSLFKVPCI
ncbi:MAG: tetratricopeptide repeat protein [bacterium]